MVLSRDTTLNPGDTVTLCEGNVDAVRLENAFIAGDSVGLATRDLCEGIGPAIRSGHRAAEAILSGCNYSLESINSHSANRNWVRGVLDFIFIGRDVKFMKKAA